MKLSKKWIDHSPDYLNKCMSKGEIKAEPDCQCGIKERHTHCKGCGKVASIGDWGAPPIATYKIRMR